MSVDLTKLIFCSPNPAFKNNAVYTGSFTLAGAAVAGANVQNFTVDLASDPDITDIQFNGPSQGPPGDNRPNDGWFKQGVIVVGSDMGDTFWSIYSSLSGATVTFTAIYVQQFIGTATLVATPVSYRVIDYSISTQ